MIKGHGIQSDHGEAGRWRTSLLGLAVLVVTLIAALLVSTSTAGSQDPPELTAPGILELLANDTDGDGFRYSPDDELAGPETELFDTTQQGRITGDQGGTADLTTLSATGAGNDPYPAVKSHEVGVRAQGEGNGTPASQVNIGPYKDILDGETVLYSQEPRAQTLTIVFDGANMPGTVAWQGEVAMSMKFGATALIEGFLGDDPEPVVTATIDCTGGPDSDCGADSGADRATTGEFGNGADTLFDRVVISVLSPADGAASLISDDPDPATSDEVGEFRTWFGISDLDGVIACGDTKEQSSPDGDYASFFTRIDSDAVDDDCTKLKPFQQEIIVGAPGGTQINFEPESTLQATYRGVLRFPSGADVTFFDRILEIDRDGPGADGFGQSQACIRTAVTTDTGDPDYARQAALAAAFPEMGAGHYPKLPDYVPGSNSVPEIACVVSYTATAGLDITFIERLDYDPWHR